MGMWIEGLVRTYRKTKASFLLLGAVKPRLLIGENRQLFITAKMAGIECWRPLDAEELEDLDIDARCVADTFAPGTTFEIFAKCYGLKPLPGKHLAADFAGLPDQN